MSGGILNAVRRGLEHWPGEFDPAERARWEGLAGDLDPHEEPEAFWSAFPGRVAARFLDRGWAWNGFYARRSETRLELVAAAGPPVCAHLDRSGGVGESGMCWDGVLLGTPLWADPVSSWPGYVSCDGESGLKTRAGLVVPLRSGAEVRAVWDLDATEPLHPADLVLMPLLLETARRGHPWPEF